MCVILGGNSVESAAPGRVKDFVAQNGGHTVITSVLIANNGIAAVKEIRSIRKWYLFSTIPPHEVLDSELFLLRWDSANVCV